MTEALPFYSSPSHAWLVVPKSQYPDASEYGTGFGYESEDDYYLEEDIEAGAFLLDHPGTGVVEILLNSRQEDRLRALPHIGKHLDIEGYLARRYPNQDDTEG